MAEVLIDLSPAALEIAVKANLYSFFTSLQRAPRTEFLVNGKLSRWFTGIGHPWFNGVLCAQQAQAGDDAAMADAIAYFQSRKVNAFTWWFAQEAALASWAPLLHGRGFIHDTGTPGLAMDLRDLADGAPLPEGLRITAVKDDQAMRIWASTFVRGYGLPPDWEPDVFDLLYGLGLEWPLQYYLATQDGVPVAASTLYLAAGVAGIYNVATVAEARHRGIGAAVTAAPLQDARALGYRAAILQASDMGFSMYQRLGFRTVCRMDHYYWSAATGGH